MKEILATIGVAGAGAFMVLMMLLMWAVIALIPAFVVTWAWNTFVVAMVSGAPELVWWQAFLGLWAIGIVGRVLFGGR